MPFDRQENRFDVGESVIESPKVRDAIAEVIALPEKVEVAHAKATKPSEKGKAHKSETTETQKPAAPKLTKSQEIAQSNWRILVGTLALSIAEVGLSIATFVSAATEFHVAFAALPIAAKITMALALLLPPATLAVGLTILGIGVLRWGWAKSREQRKKGRK